VLRSSGFAAVVGAAQVYIYIRQAQIMSTQADIAMTANGFTAAVQRAFVFSTGIKLTGYSAQNGAAVFWTFAAEWRNSGNTRAKNLTIDLNCWDEATSIMDHPEQFPAIPNSKNGLPSFIGPQATREIGRCTLRNEYVATIQRENRAFYFAARANYDDTFGGLHRITEICAEMTPLVGDPNNLVGGITGYQATPCPALP
jgi:hypothetical protein